MIIGRTLGRYLSARFVKTVLAVFLSIVSLVYLVDFIEMLRRAINVPEASARTIAYGAPGFQPLAEPPDASSAARPWRIWPPAWANAPPT